MKYIYGLNKSGQSIINYLNLIKENYYCWDNNKRIRNRLMKLDGNINLVKPQDINLKLIDELFITPGVSLRNSNLKIFKKNHIKFYRDLELYSRITKNKKIIAITGTNGKSTTTKLISDVLKKSKIDNFKGGNIGIPLLDFTKINNKIKHHVIELSSFQLESFDTFNPFISILLNITPDHLDRYKDYEDHAFQKEKIIISNKNNFNIVCVDYKKNLEIYNRYKKKIIPISKDYLNHGIYYKDNYIIDNYFKIKKNIKLSSLSISLFGTFNIENIIAAYVVSRILNIRTKDFIDVLAKFKGLPHRLENIYHDKKLQIINNSKATNLFATLNAIINYENIYLILGGKLREKNFKKILNYSNKIIKIYLIGESTEIIFKQLKDTIVCEKCENLEIATKKIFSDIKSKKVFNTMLFSPACTSFDQFINFEKRGNFFKKIINRHLNE